MTVEPREGEVRPARLLLAFCIIVSYVHGTVGGVNVLNPKLWYVHLLVYHVGVLKIELYYQSES